MSSIKVVSTVISVSSSAWTLLNIISDLHRLCSQCHHHQLHQISVQCHHIQNFSKYSTLSFLGVARWRGCGEPCLFLEGSSFWGLCSLSKDTKFPWGWRPEWASSGRLRSAGDRLSQVLLLTFGKKSSILFCFKSAPCLLGLVRFPCWFWVKVEFTSVGSQVGTLYRV